MERRGNEILALRFERPAVCCDAAEAGGLDSSKTSCAVTETLSRFTPSTSSQSMSVWLQNSNAVYWKFAKALSFNAAVNSPGRYSCDSFVKLEKKIQSIQLVDAGYIGDSLKEIIIYRNISVAREQLFQPGIVRVLVSGIVSQPKRAQTRLVFHSTEQFLQ